MATQVVPLPQVKLPSGPAPLTAEQRYWKGFQKPLLLPSPTNYPVTHISHNSEHFAVTTGTRVQLYSSKTRKLVKTITRFSDIARSGDLRQDGRVLVAGDDTGRIQVFDINSRAILKTWTHADAQPVHTTRFSPVHPTTVLSTGDDRTVRLWDLASSDATVTFTGHGDYVRSGRFMPGNMARMVVSGSYDATVRVWDPRVGRAVMTFKHGSAVEDVEVLPGGTTVLAAAGNVVSVLDLVAGRPLRVLSNHQKTVTSLGLASGGRRVLTGGLEGHVKVFETGGWNVVESIKYASPILSLAVIPTASSSTASSGDSGADDRHLAVGMSTGVLSIRTRLSGMEAQRERERDKEMAALLAGTISAHDAKTQKRKRKVVATRRLEVLGASADTVITNEEQKRRKERAWQNDLRHARYGAALDRVLDTTAAEYSPMNALTLLLALRHRSALRDALDNRDESGVRPVLAWVCRHICDPRFVSVCVEVGVGLLDLYGEYVADSKELHDGFRLLHRRVGMEVERAQLACQSGGMLESVFMGM